MNRRTFVVSALSLTLPAMAGCPGGNGDEEEEEDDFEPGDGVSRQVLIESENLLRRSDSLIRQDGSVFVTVRLENAGTEQVGAEVTLQMHDSEGASLGTPFTQQRGPIVPGQTVQLRFETGLDPQAVGGYALTVTEFGGGDEETSDSGQGSGNETQNSDSETQRFGAEGG